LHLQKERMPEAARLADHAGTRMLTYLKGYLSYLANYRNLPGVQDERAQWPDRIIGEIERYVEAGAGVRGETVHGARPMAAAECPFRK
jgi:hypothetical protein